MTMSAASFNGFPILTGSSEITADARTFLEELDPTPRSPVTLRHSVPPPETPDSVIPGMFRAQRRGLTLSAGGLAAASIVEKPEKLVTKAGGGDACFEGYLQDIEAYQERFTGPAEQHRGPIGSLGALVLGFMRRSQP